MTQQRLIAIVLALGITLGGCTKRFSQSLTGAIPNDTGTEVRSSDTGLAVFGIVFDEPQPAHEQVRSIIGACQKLTSVEVDYRELWFILFGIPKVTVNGTCVR